MFRLGGTASESHMVAFEGLQSYLQREGIDMDWVLYSSYDALVEAFVSGEIDVAWNGPLSYVKIKRLLDEPCQVVAMRDVDVDFVTHFITRPNSGISGLTDLGGKRFAFGGRGSVEAGLLAYHFLKQAGVNPRDDLATFTFHDERGPGESSDEVDVVERVASGEYDAGAVSRPALRRMEAEGTLPTGGVRIFWSSPTYSHCCFTARPDMDESLSRRFTEALVSMAYDDPAGKSVLDAEGCKYFVRGTLAGWEMLEEVAEEEGLV